MVALCKNPALQPLLERLIDSGFRRKKLRESGDPTVVSALTMEDPDHGVSIEIDLVMGFAVTRTKDGLKLQEDFSTDDPDAAARSVSAYLRKVALTIMLKEAASTAREIMKNRTVGMSHHERLTSDRRYPFQYN